MTKSKLILSWKDWKAATLHRMNDRERQFFKETHHKIATNPELFNKAERHLHGALYFFSQWLDAERGEEGMTLIIRDDNGEHEETARENKMRWYRSTAAYNLNVARNAAR